MDFFISCDLANTENTGDDNFSVELHSSHAVIFPINLDWKEVVPDGSFTAWFDGYYEISLSFHYARKNWQDLHPVCNGVHVVLSLLRRQTGIDFTFLDVTLPSTLLGTASGSAITPLKKGDSVPIIASTVGTDDNTIITITGGKFVAKRLADLPQKN